MALLMLWQASQGIRIPQRIDTGIDLTADNVDAFLAACRPTDAPTFRLGLESASSSFNAHGAGGLMASASARDTAMHPRLTQVDRSRIADDVSRLGVPGAWEPFRVAPTPSRRARLTWRPPKPDGRAR
jgi:hypothetical protein